MMNNTLNDRLCQRLSISGRIKACCYTIIGIKRSKDLSSMSCFSLSWEHQVQYNRYTSLIRTSITLLMSVLFTLHDSYGVPNNYKQIKVLLLSLW